MRSIFRKLLSAALAAAILFPSLPVRASDALGHDLAAAATPLGFGTELASGTFWSDSHADLRQENYVVYTPNAMVTPVVTYGGTTRALTTVPEAAQVLEAQGWRVLAGINGDYFSMAHGVPLGSTMVNGALRNVNSDAYYAVGFRADGSSVIGDPKLTISASVNGGVSGFPIFSYNHVRHSEYGVCLYDGAFNDRSTTGTSEPGVDVICSVVGGALTIGGQLLLSVDEVLPQATDTAVPEGKFILTANLKADERYTAPLLALLPGDQLAVSVVSGTGESAWNEVVNLIGAPELLVENGVVREGLGDGSAPRTAIGQRADGSLIFYTIDGRRAGYSIGATLTATAMRLAELGCVTAVALDGGGSTTLVATQPDEWSARVVNTPSEALRAVSNHVFLVTPNVPSGIPDHVYLAPSATKALPGATVTLRAAVLDTNYIPMGFPVTLSSDLGMVAGNSLTLPAGYVGAVTAFADFGGIMASAVVEAVTPERIAVLQDGAEVSAVTIPPNGMVTLTAQGITNHLPIAGGNECFAWSFEGEGISLLPDGALVAGGGAGAGTLTVSLGEQSVTLPVTVSLLPHKLLTDFETAFEPLTDSADPPLLKLSRSTASAYVKLGRASGKLEYKLDGENPLTLPVDYAVGVGYDSAELWVYGNGGSASLSLTTDAGTTEPLALSYTGWQHVSFALPAGTTRLTGLTVSGASAVHGNFLIDQLALAHSAPFDADAPELSLTANAELGILTASAFDACDGAALPTLRLEYDGAALPYDRDARTGAITALLPAYDGLAHQLTLTAGDASGNLARASLYTPAGDYLAPAFPDVEGHWAAGAIEYLKRSGVSNGGDGGLYHPDDNISRQEFAVMLYRYLQPQGDFSGTALPFTDAAQIAPWALDAARAMYALGVVSGAKALDGSLSYNPTASITRQEAMTMLGRLFERGYASAALPACADAAEVADWAAEQVALLASFGALDDFVTETLAPATPLTRAEMAAMLLRMR